MKARKTSKGDATLDAELALGIFGDAHGGDLAFDADPLSTCAERLLCK